jgi:hypothetical protein
MLGTITQVNGGTWVRYDAFGPPLAAFAADLTNGPLTILWKGSVDIWDLQKFFFDAAHAVLPRDRIFYRTRTLSPTDRDVVESADKPEIGRLAQEARFVRFECSSVAGGVGEDLPDPTLIAWAMLDTQEDESQESIGIYLRREDIKAIRPQIEAFLSDTVLARSLPSGAVRVDLTRRALDALSQDLG